MAEKWEQLGYDNHDSLDKAKLLNDQKLFAKKMFGDQILHESKSDLGKWVAESIPGVKYVNVFRSEDDNFRINKPDSYYPNISIHLNYDYTEPKDSSIDIRVITADKEQKVSNIFTFEDASINDIKNFILENKDIFV